MLIDTMLNKDPNKRPNIWDLASTPCIKERINQFVDEHNCRDSVESIFDLQTNYKTKQESSLYIHIS